MPAKRMSEAGSDGTPSKHARTSNGGDFSGSVRKKLTGTSRTGQACDRCKIRKIRCDARPGGCSPCLQNNLECKTTDRITGRATSRGHTESIEAENITLKQYVSDLRAQIQETGMEPRPAPVMPMAYVAPGGSPTFGWPAQTFDLTQILSDSADKSRGRGAGLPDYRAGPGSLGDNYLGVSGSNEWVSPIKGTSLTLFGMELDLAEFITNDAQEAFSPTSYENFLQVAFGGHIYEPPSLPPYQECKAFCEWYFKAVNCHAPIVHKPAILDMVDRLHTDASYSPSIAETVQLHMVLAMMLFQYSTRNAIQNNWADHYRYAVSYLQKLMQERTLSNMQAIALICLHLRNFTKPGAAWFMSSLTLTLCIEMGLHRSVNAWNKSAPEMGELEIELRKRVFWSVLVIHCSISNKLGRPLAVRLEDFDVEFPKPIHDFTAAESQCDDWHKCSFRVGCHNFKWVLVNLQVQSTIYSVRAPPHSYELTLQKLEKDLEVFKKSIPIELSGGPQTAQDDRVCSLYLQFGSEELNLLIHHPAVCRTQSQEVMNKNLDICLQASSELLRIAQGMRALKGLDTTWLNATVWLSAMFVTLFTWHQRKDRITSAQLNDLKADMETWLGIIGDIGQMLGSGPRLQIAVRSIVSTAIDTISKDLAARTASAAVASAAMARTSPQAVTSEAGDHSGMVQYSTAPPGYAPVYSTDGGPSPNDPNNPSPYLDPAHDPSLTSPPGPYPSVGGSGGAANFSYPDPPGTSVPTYSSNGLTFDNPYPQSDTGVDIKPDLQAQLAAHNSGQPLQAQLQPSHHHHHQQHQQQQLQDQQAQQFMQAFGGNGAGNDPTSTNPFAPVHHHHHHHQQEQQQQQNLYGPAAWRHFTTDMMSLFNNGFGNLSSPYPPLESASTLLALGSNNNNNNNNSNTAADSTSPSSVANKLPNTTPSSASGINGATGAGDNQSINVMALQGVSDASVGSVLSGLDASSSSSNANNIANNANNNSAGPGNNNNATSTSNNNNSNSIVNSSSSSSSSATAAAVAAAAAALWPLSTYGPVTSTPSSLGGM
ncbi:hypothetical protein AAFC00_007269 [Neodothiora populina]|uniref:Zn(2)-C6 fungal-type domain-containing protein n=1 Tax=Neodothiora populina TaxID=2781224 RepID=A0ABR3PIV0_9PEZI